VLTRADCKDNAGRVSAPDDYVLRLGRAVHEIPLLQRPLLALDDQQRLAGEDEKVFLVGFPVVHPDRLTRREHIETDSDLGNSNSPSKGRRSPRPWRWRQRASRAFSTNHPSPAGTSPLSVSSNGASGTMVGG
jgi:hypothetical protein